MINDTQIRIGAKANGEATLHLDGPRMDNGFEWQVVDLMAGQEVNSIYASGETRELGDAFTQSREAFQRVIRQKHPGPPVRHEFECRCGAQLSAEARRSRRTDGWDTPREIICNCGRVYGVQLSFTGGKPSLQTISRSA